MSGGVDSSVAGYFCCCAGLEVIGVTMKVWPQELYFAREDDAAGRKRSLMRAAWRILSALGRTWLMKPTSLSDWLLIISQAVPGLAARQIRV